MRALALVSEPADTALVAIRSEGLKPPLFCVHAQAGHVRLFRNLLPYLAPGQPIQGLQAVPCDETEVPYRSFEAMADRYAREIRAIHPDGPYLIVGECLGGVLAYELAQQLRAQGEHVPLLALVDAYPPGGARLRPTVPESGFRTMHRLRILAFHVRTLMRSDLDGKVTYVTERVRRILGEFRVKVFSGATEPFAQRARRSFQEAFDTYQPSPYSGRVVLLRAGKLPWGLERDPDLGWADLVAELETVELPGYFATNLSEPAVRRLAEKLEEHL